MPALQLTIPTHIKAEINLPSSKSISNRVLIINALSGETILPENLSRCDDTRVMRDALSGDGQVIDIMAAGTAMRFLTAYLSVSPGTRIITGTERMRQRPVKVLVEALRSLGAEIHYTENDGYPPLRITGKKLRGGDVELPGNISSQYVSALLMIAPTLKDGLKLTLTGGIISQPYIDLTLSLMKEFGAEAQRHSPGSISVAHSRYRSIPFRVEGDWSAASYWFQLAALAEQAEIDLPGLLPHSNQGDRRGAELFERLGVKSVFTAAGLHISRQGSSVERMEEDFTDIPDLAQTFAVTCALLNIPFRFTGLQTLKIKETDRLEALTNELLKLGYVLRHEDDSVLCWDGRRVAPRENPIIHTYEDHRMAMAFAPAAMYYPQLSIADPHVVSKSYPEYWDDLQKAGAQLRT